MINFRGTIFGLIILKTQLPTEPFLQISEPKNSSYETIKLKFVCFQSFYCIWIQPGAMILMAKLLVQPQMVLRLKFIEPEPESFRVIF